MPGGAIVHYSDDGEHPHAGVVLGNGDRLELTLDRDGLAIRRSVLPTQPPQFVFWATADEASHLCAGLFTLEDAPKPTPLRILAAAVVQMDSAAQVAQAFRAALAQVR